MAVCFAGELHINECRQEGKSYRLISGATDAGSAATEGEAEREG